jgi:hypothetical protein
MVTIHREAGFRFVIFIDDHQPAPVRAFGAGEAELNVTGLLAGMFGTAAHMARLAGQARTPAKSAAAGANGAKGGRPRGRVVVG